MALVSIQLRWIPTEVIGKWVGWIGSSPDRGAGGGDGSLFLYQSGWEVTMHAALLVFSHIKWPKGQVPVFKGPLGNFHLEVVFFLIYVFFAAKQTKK